MWILLINLANPKIVTMKPLIIVQLNRNKSFYTVKATKTRNGNSELEL